VVSEDMNWTELPQDQVQLWIVVLEML